MNARWSSFEHFDVIQFTSDIAPLLDTVDLCIFLDGNGYTRFSYDSEALDRSPAQKICIDHHGGTPDRYDLTCIDSHAASTAELIYLLFYADLPRISPRDCELLLLGIIGDTGSFTYIRPEQAYVFGIAERLVREGQLDIQAMKARYYPFPEKIYAGLQKLSSNVAFYTMGSWPRCFTTFVNRDFLSEANFSYKELHHATDIFTGQLLSVANITWGIMIYPKSENEYGLSMRSLPGSVNVRLLAETLGVGGGHDRAAGGTFTHASLTAADQLHQLLQWLSEHDPIY
jgi:phosphoesterase RecJ-like protein